MRQKPLHSTLGFKVLRSRREAGLTQMSLAAAVGISLPTLRQAERGKGSLATLTSLVAALGKEIGGRSLPPGESLGERLAALRLRQRLGRRTLAAIAGCSPTTLASLEAGGDCHLAVAVRVAEALGTELVLATPGEQQSFWNGAGHVEFLPRVDDAAGSARSALRRGRRGFRLGPVLACPKRSQGAGASQASVHGGR